MKSKQQIDAEVKMLREIKTSVRHYTAFGDNNWDAVEAQIVVLEGGFSEDTCYDVWSGDDDEHVRESALAAVAWRDDDDNYDHPESLVGEWMPLVRGPVSMKSE